MKITEALLDIDQVNQLTGLSHATLRNWEKRYGFPSPQRSQGGHRLFEVADIHKLREVVKLHKGGMKVREAIGQVIKGVAEVEVASGFQKNSQQTLSACLTQILEALYKYDVSTAEMHLSRLGLRLSETDLLEMVYPNLLMQVGHDWERGHINVAQEHFSWSFLRTRLLNFFKMVRSDMQQPKALLATPSGELHEGGLLILAAYLMLRGWDIYYLGVNLPMHDLKHSCMAIQPDIVCLSSICAENVKKNWVGIEDLEMPVAIGGACLHQLNLEELPVTSRVSLIGGDLSSSVAQMELVLHSAPQKLKLVV
ncbi:MerR family transcriptional regulator [Bdellovibrio svalbardensis]|uniref:MerR family transcriptional regulator n=1 Tax=Bdellovibrio svalbardensis TaxID=2972972 RepID=A0ABT6DMQ7_9BACT|nr:MerR family transcriptional regulator [Bdellovibrio svalbardensis]MDG0818157.1 MerR family transcriptional regulator [Bdellovibrio svalbardensis]